MMDTIASYAIYVIGFCGLLLLTCAIVEFTWFIVKWTLNAIIAHYGATKDLIEWARQKYKK